MKTTPQPKTDHALIFLRSIAYLIDSQVISAVVMGPIFWSIFRDLDNVRVLENHVWLIMLVGFSSIMAKDLWGGRSLGKRLFKLRVVTDDDAEQTPSVGALLLRNAPLFIWPLEFFASLTDSRQQRFGDRWAKTKVIKTGNVPVTSILSVIVVGLIVVFAAFMIGFMSFFKSTPAYQTAIADVAQRPEVISRVGEVTGFGMMPSGNITMRGSVGEASFVLLVKGTKRTARVLVNLSKPADGEWYVYKAEVLR